MGAPLIGPAGGLIRLPGSSASDVTKPQRSRFTQYLDGTIREQKGPRPRRAWSEEVGTAKPEYWHALEGLDQGLYGLGPWYWYDSMSQVTNMLTPFQTSLDPVSWLGSGSQVGGAGVAEDGTQYLRSIVSDPNTDLFLSSGHVHAQYTAVPTNAPVTASMYATAFSGSAGWWAITEYDSMGTAIGAAHRVDVPAGEVRTRRHVTFTTSPTTVSVRISARNLLMVAMPAITLTSELAPWAWGRGCTAASLSLGGESVQAAYGTTPGARRSGYSMSIQEIG